MPSVAARAFVLLLPAAAAAAAAAQQQPVSVGPEARVIVLPFTNLSGQSDDAWLTNGIAETIRNDVTASSRFIVVESVSADRDDSIWVVSGVFQRVAGDIRITARLRDADGRTVRVAKVDGPLSEVFALQDRVVAALGMSYSLGTVGSLAGDSTGGPVATASREGRRALDLATNIASGATERTGAGGFAITGGVVEPPPPMPPEVESRDSFGGATVRAVRVVEPILVDGRLTEAIYDDTPSISGFIQQEPSEGAPATERTEAWVFFDDNNIYIAARCWQSRMDQVVANEMRRDEIFRNDNFAIVFDTYHDRRKGVLFRANPIGALMDMEFTEDPTFNIDWNTVWDVGTGYFDGGWTVEFEIPFRSLRYPSGDGRPWGINFGRTVLSKNERSFLTLIPASLGSRGFTTTAYAGNLVGLDVPSSSTNIEVKPYAIGGLTSDFVGGTSARNKLSGNTGFDAKYGITQSLTADFTINTDFAQVEVDEQQVNLTRFNLFFPEKREFFLEGQGLFEFGGGRGFSGGGSSAYRRGRRVTNTPALFFSRRIGLEGGRVVPIRAGGRLTGKVGPFSIAALTIQSEREQVTGVPAINFSVLRIKRDVFRRSAIGGIFTGRSASTVSHGSNQAYGFDGVFSFYDNVNLNTYVAKTRTAGLSGDDHSYRGQFNYSGDRYGLQVEQLSVGANFNPEVGFVRRHDFDRTFGSARFSPRPRAWESIRKLSWEASIDYTTDGAGVLETRVQSGVFGVEFENSDEMFIDYSLNYEFLKVPFKIAPGIIIPVGGYQFQNTRFGYAFGPQRWFSGTASIEHGSFFDGEKTAVTLIRPRVELMPQLSFEPILSFNWLELPQESFATTLVSSRVTYTLTPRLFVGALVQYNSSNNTIGTNARLRWEYQPGSELFVVYTEERDTMSLMPDRTALLRNKGFVVKLNRLFRF